MLSANSMRFGAVLFAAGALVSGVAAQETTFDWSTIEPSEELVYSSCYGGSFQCARLELPLDYKNDADTRKVAIAIQKLPAAVNETDPAFAGPVFMNPGGPGASGTEFGVSFNAYLQNMIDVPDERHYEIISFDPRGIGQSTPGIDCWEGDVLSRAAWELQRQASGGLDGGDHAVGYNMALQEGRNKRCIDADAENPIMGYVGSDNVARDMIEMLDKIEALRKTNTKRCDEFERRQAGNESDDSLPRIQYIGFSYGTVLGNYLASMFPGRIGRMVLDGVIDPEDHALGPGWTENTLDTDAVADDFFAGCFAAGPVACAMSRATDTSGEDVAKRFWDFVAETDEIPLSYVYQGQVVALNGEDFRYALRTMLYNPLTWYTTLPYVINLAIIGYPEAMIEALVNVQRIPILNQNCPVETAPFQASAGVVDAQDAVVCNDGTDVSDEGRQYWQDYVDTQAEQSDVSGAYWSTIRFACHAWPFPLNDPFRGPFTTPEADPSGVEGKPLAPILFLSNKLDPATPLAAARSASEAHPGSQVVIQDASGHTALPSFRSPCMSRIVRTYFANGTVPDSEVTCQPACTPWNPAACSSTPVGASVDAIASVLEDAGAVISRSVGSMFDLTHRQGGLFRRFPLGVM